MNYLLNLLLILCFSYNAFAGGNHRNPYKTKKKWSNTRKVNKSNWEIGISSGLTQYVGELSTTIPHPKSWKPYIGASTRFTVNPYWSLRFNGTHGTISGSDALSRSYSHNQRNLSFATSIEEASFQFEWNILGFEPINKRKPFTPFIFSGISLYHFNPRALYKGQWYDLQPLGTEGQGIPGYGPKYNLNQISIPFGGGLKYGFRASDGNYLSISAEMSIHKTFTDFLDDVSGNYMPLDFLEKNNGKMAAELSIRADEFYGYHVDYTFDSTRGSPKTKDWYVYSGLTIAYIFYKKKYFYNFAN